MTEEALASALKLQAGVCARMGSAFSAGFLEAAARDLDEGGVAAALLAPFGALSVEQLFGAAAPLRFLGAFHDLALSGEAPALTAAYPAQDRSGDGERAWAAAAEAATGRMASLAMFMSHEPQTNEVLRSAVLLGGFLEVAAAAGLPLRCFEIAASAGLNQFWDRYRYDLGAAGAWGPADSPVRLATDWSGGRPPLEARVAVADRAACDRAPIDLRQPEQRRRLTAYIWADQLDRLARLRAAIETALDAGVSVERSDAAAWTRARCAPRDGFATVLYHSIFWQYVGAAGQAELRGDIEAQGARATASAPFAWLRMEPREGSLTQIELRLTGWPGGEERLLAEVHAHGASVAWKG